MNAEEALEIPPVIPLELDTNLTTSIDLIKKNLDERKKIFQKIAEQDFEDIVFVPQKNDRKTSKKVANASSSLPLHNKNTHQESSLNSIVNNCTNGDIISQSNHSLDNDLNIPEDLLSQSQQNMETIQKAVQDKEQRLSTYLNLDLSEYMDKSITSSNDLLIESQSDLIFASTTAEISKEHNNSEYYERTGECRTTISEKIEISENEPHEDSKRDEGSDAKDKTLLESNFTGRVIFA